MEIKKSKLHSNASKFGLQINVKKTEVISLNTKQAPEIQLDGNSLMNTNSFTYLGSIVTSEGGAEEDIKARLGTFTRLKNIWKSTSISRKTKMRLYNCCVLPVLLYGAECWRTNTQDILAC